MDFDSRYGNMAVMILYDSNVFHDFQKERGFKAWGRQKRYHTMVVEGKANWEMLKILSISKRSVKFHDRNITRKPNASTIVVSQNII